MRARWILWIGCLLFAVPFARAQFEPGSATYKWVMPNSRVLMIPVTVNSLKVPWSGPIWKQLAANETSGIASITMVGRWGKNEQEGEIAWERKVKPGSDKLLVNDNWTCPTWQPVNIGAEICFEASAVQDGSITFVRAPEEFREPIPLGPIIEKRNHIPGYKNKPLAEIPCAAWIVTDGSSFSVRMKFGVPSSTRLVFLGSDATHPDRIAIRIIAMGPEVSTSSATYSFEFLSQPNVTE